MSKKRDTCPACHPHTAHLPEPCKGCTCHPKKPKKEKPVCTCDPKKLESRGLCSMHGFDSLTWLTPERRALNEAEAMPPSQLLEEIFNLAEVGIDACDSEDSIYSDPERIKLRAIMATARVKITPSTRHS